MKNPRPWLFIACLVGLIGCSKPTSEQGGTTTCRVVVVIETPVPAAVCPEKKVAAKERKECSKKKCHQRPKKEKTETACAPKKKKEVCQKQKTSEPKCAPREEREWEAGEEEWGEPGPPEISCVPPSEPVPVYYQAEPLQQAPPQMPEAPAPAIECPPPSAPQPMMAAQPPVMANAPPSMPPPSVNLAADLTPQAPAIVTPQPLFTQPFVAPVCSPPIVPYCPPEPCRPLYRHRGYRERSYSCDFRPAPCPPRYPRYCPPTPYCPPRPRPYCPPRPPVVPHYWLDGNRRCYPLYR